MGNRATQKTTFRKIRKLSTNNKVLKYTTKAWNKVTFLSSVFASSHQATNNIKGNLGIFAYVLESDTK
jgi:hypothetical protein